MNEAVDLNLEYNARLTVLNHEEYSGRWDEESRDYRASADAELDLAYGAGERNRFDFFKGEGADGSEPVIAYIHGGYWRSRSKETFSHVAKGFNARGISVAIPSYDLCPNVKLAEIIAQMRDFLVTLWNKTGQHPAVVGHSAGGHLSACMFATDWSAVEGAPDDLVRRAYALSGLYDLMPVLQTDVNDDLRLSEEEARAASPAFWNVPASGGEFTAVVGAQESDAFRHQSRFIVEQWQSQGVRADFAELAGLHHFSILDALTAPDSEMADRVAGMARAAPRG